MSKKLLKLSRSFTTLTLTAGLVLPSAAWADEPAPPAEEIFQRAIDSGIITDAASLVSATVKYAAFADGVGTVVSDSIQHVPVNTNKFLSAKFDFVLSLLAKASFKEIHYIFANVDQGLRGVAYEELYRSGRLEQMPVEEILALLRMSRTRGSVYDAGFPNAIEGLSPTQAERDDIDRMTTERLNAVNIRLVPAFQKKSPTKVQKKDFIKLSAFFVGQYVLARATKYPLPSRDYSVAGVSDARVAHAGVCPPLF